MTSQLSVSNTRKSIQQSEKPKKQDLEQNEILAQSKSTTPIQGPSSRGLQSTTQDPINLKDKEGSILPLPDDAPVIGTPSSKDIRAKRLSKQSPSSAVLTLNGRLKKITSEEMFIRQGDAIIKFTNKRAPLERMEANRNLANHQARLQEIKEARGANVVKQFKRAGEKNDL